MPDRILACALALAFSAAALAYADEERDWGVAPVLSLRQAPYSAPTPLRVPGARTVHTDELKRLLQGGAAPLILDVAGGSDHLSLPGAIWLPDLGRGASFIDTIQARAAEQLASLTLGNRGRALVFLCVDPQCWLSYNASLRAISLGYTSVFWYRGGILAWRSAGLPLEPVTALDR
ncbi:MAG: sulfurtransferase [Burkholderiales bacterium]|nr:sulfurtransferase [Burkholderiales bacterium]